jgi:hypothetical protein
MAVQAHPQAKTQVLTRKNKIIKEKNGLGHGSGGKAPA